MNLRILVFLFFILQVWPYITNDSGYSKVWFYTNSWTGVKGTTQTQTINYQGAFQNIPQVIISPFILQNYLQSTTSYGYKLEISSITTTNFQVKLSLDYNNIANFCFSWLAFDDSRYLVIHKFNQDNPQTNIIPHTFTGAFDGIVFFTSFVAKNTLDFTFDLGTITSTSVEVLITNSNLVNLGYIIVLGTEGMLVSSLLKTELPTLSNYPCTQVNLIQDKIWFYYPIYFSLTAQDVYIEFTQNYNSLTSKYCLKTWSTGSYLKFGHQNTFFSFVQSDLQPMLMQKLRVSKKEIIQQVNQIQIEISEMNVIYNTIGDNILIIPSSISTLSIKTSIYCQIQQKVIGKLLKSTSIQYFESKNYCFGAQNFIQFYSKYGQTVAHSQYLIIQIANNQIKVSQKLYNQQFSTITIFQADIIF